LAEFGQALLHKYGCYKNVYELRGNLAQFKRKRCPKPINGPAYNLPQRYEGEIIQIDKNSAYPSVYRDFDGIPTGKPKIIPQFNPDSLKCYYIAINITEFKSRNEADPYPLITETGIMYLNKSMFDYINENYDIKFDFITGVSFSGFNKKLSDLTEILYEMRLDAKKKGSEVQQVIKRLMNSLWGKSIQKEDPIWKKEMPSSKLDNFIEFNRDFIHSYKAIDNFRTKVDLMKPIVSDFITPQFASEVLSYSKIQMLVVVQSCINCKIDVFYVNTDSITMVKKPKEGNQNLIECLISDKMGQFSIEVESKLFIALGPCKNIHVLHDGSTRVRFHNKMVFNEIQFFEDLYKEMTN
jgi:hypothetical protein